MTGQSEGPKPSSPWLKNNLVKLGSAAVFTVYSAGYFRTREAADRFAGESVQRHAAAIAAPQGNGNALPEQTETPQHDSAALPVMHLSSAPKAAPAKARESAAPAPVPAATTADTAANVSPAPAPVEVVAPIAPVAPAPVAPVPATPADSTAPNAEKKSESWQLKDGVYYGWGTSRHGDIQASVEIKSGKIIGAYISQCRTQYSCSWVSALPGQVLQRQSAEVDYVSGATQSSNAFYYAVMEALKKAK
jgi:uncharacterized protein with FMN-binding domain